MQTLVGSSFFGRISDRKGAPLRIGKQTWTLHELATQLGVVHAAAARLVTHAAESIGARSVRDLYARSSPYTFAGVERFGETTMYVLLRLFESEGLNVDEWATAGNEDAALVAFRSLKLREQRAEKRTREGARRSSDRHSQRAVAAATR